MKQTAVTFRQAKGQRKLAMLTAYDATIARLMDDHVDAVLVGDSLGMVMLGRPDTLSVTMDQMIHHCAAVAIHGNRTDEDIAKLGTIEGNQQKVAKAER